MKRLIFSVRFGFVCLTALFAGQMAVAASLPIATHEIPMGEDGLGHLGGSGLTAYKPSGGDDWANLELLMALARTTSGELSLAPGNYSISAALPCSYVHVKGDGFGINGSTTDPNTSPVTITVNNTSGAFTNGDAIIGGWQCHISGVRFIGTGIGADNTDGLSVVGSHVIVDDFSSFTGFRHSVACDLDGTAAGVVDLELQNSAFESTTDDNVFIGRHCANTWIIRNNISQSDGNLIHIGAGAVLVTDNTLARSCRNATGLTSNPDGTCDPMKANGILIQKDDSDPTQLTTNSFIFDNFIDHTGCAAIRDEGSNGTIIDRNIISRSGAGFANNCGGLSAQIVFDGPIANMVIGESNSFIPKTVRDNGTGAVVPDNTYALGPNAAQSCGGCALHPSPRKMNAGYYQNLATQRYVEGSQVSGVAVPNLLANGQFDVWPGGTSFAPNCATTQHIAVFWNGRFSCGTNGSRVFSRVTGFNGAQYALNVRRVDGNADTNFTVICYQIPSADAIKYQGNALHFTADVETDSGFTSGGLSASMTTGTGIDEVANCAGGTFPTGSTNNQFTSNFPTTIGPGFGPVPVSFGKVNIPATATELMLRIQYAPTGTALNDDYSFTNANLTLGTDMTPLQPVPFRETMLQSLYQYRKTFAYGTAPASNVGYNTGEYQWNVPTGLSGAVAVISPSFQFGPMRATPTVTLFSPLDSSNQCYDKTQSAAMTSSAAVNVTDHSLAISAVGPSAMQPGDQIVCHATLSAQFP